MAPGEEIADLQTLSGGIYRNYVNTVLVRAGQPVPETIRDSVGGTVFGLRYKRTVYYVQRIGSTAVTETCSTRPQAALLASDGGRHRRDE